MLSVCLQLPLKWVTCASASFWSLDFTACRCWDVSLCAPSQPFLFPHPISLSTSNLKLFAPCALETFLAVGWVKNLLVVAWVLLPSADCRAHLREPKFPKFVWPSGDLLCPLCSLVLGIPTCPRARYRDCKHPQQQRAGTWPLLVLPKAVTSFFGCPGKSAGCWGCSSHEAWASLQWEMCSPWLSMR